MIPSSVGADAVGFPNQGSLFVFIVVLLMDNAKLEQFRRAYMGSPWPVREGDCFMYDCFEPSSLMPFYNPLGCMVELCRQHRIYLDWLQMSAPALWP